MIPIKKSKDDGVCFCVYHGNEAEAHFSVTSIMSNPAISRVVLTGEGSFGSLVCVPESS